MEETRPEIAIYIRDYSVTFYGGKKSEQNKYRVVAALYDDFGKLTSWVKFYDDKDDIENDMIDKDKIIHLNLPISSYQSLILTLRSNRPIQIIFHNNQAMLMEL